MITFLGLPIDLGLDMVQRKIFAKKPIQGIWDCPLPNTGDY